MQAVKYGLFACPILYFFYKTMKTYNQRKKEHEKIISDAHMIRAFSKEQLESNPHYQEAVKNNEKLYNYCGALITKKNYEAFKKKDEESWAEFKDLCQNDDFLQEVMEYELRNHEYVYSRSFDVFEFLEIEKTPRTLAIFKKAEKKYLSHDFL